MIPEMWVAASMSLPVPPIPPVNSAAGVLMAALVVILYFVPVIVAVLRRHPQTASLLVINFFLAPTVIAWVLCLAWACWRFDKPDPARPPERVVSKES